MNIINRLNDIRDKLIRCEVKNHRLKGSVALLAVSKTQPIEKIMQAYDAGQYQFGENYLQEAEEKIAQLKDKKIEWHFIGNIQSNKTRKIAELFDWVQSVDSVKHAKRLNEQRPAELGPLHICLEVNLDHEANKSGVDQEELLLLAKACQGLPMLNLRGLMAIPHKTSNTQEQHASFKHLRQLFDDLNQQGFALDTLSMGMSNDFEIAIAEGSTMIRVGTAIFGERR